MENHIGKSYRDSHGLVTDGEVTPLHGEVTDDLQEG